MRNSIRPSRDLEFARPRRIFLEFTRVEEIIEHADAEEGRGHIDVETGDPLHRLVQHDDRGDEREQASGLVAANDDGVAAIEHDSRDGEAPEALHDRACARAHRCELVGRGLEASDRRALPLAHEVFEGEGLDDADALRGLLQRLHHLHHAREFRGHDPSHALSDLAHAERRHGHEHQGEDREHRVLRHHHDHEADDGQGVARQGRDQQVEGVARRLGDERLPRDELRRMRLAVIGDIHPQHLVEDARLDVGDDAVGDPRQRHLLAVGGEALDGVDGDDRRGDLPDSAELVRDEDLVDDLSDDPGRQRGRQGDQAHHGK